MRLGTMGLVGLTMAVLMTLGTAQAADKPPAAAAAASPPLAEGSALAGLGFGDKPFRLSGAAFADTMNQLAGERQKSCGPLESFGWEIGGDVQSQVDKLTGTLMGALRQGKFLVKEIKSKLFANSELVVPYSADRSDRHLLLLLSLSPATPHDPKAQLVLLICEVKH